VKLEPDFDLSLHPRRSSDPSIPSDIVEWDNEAAYLEARRVTEDLVRRQVRVVLPVIVSLLLGILGSVVVAQLTSEQLIRFIPLGMGAIAAVVRPHPGVQEAEELIVEPR
jgi:hypothetical protein